MATKNAYKGNRSFLIGAANIVQLIIRHDCPGMDLFSWLFVLEKQYAQKRKITVNGLRPLFIQKSVAQKMITFTSTLFYAVKHNH